MTTQQTTGSKAAKLRQPVAYSIETGELCRHSNTLGFYWVTAPCENPRRSQKTYTVRLVGGIQGDMDADRFDSVIKDLDLRARRDHD
jgi:hypothetical protein